MTTFYFYAIIKPTNETGGCFIMTWKVWYYDDGLKITMYVTADSCDDAIALARQFDTRYCAGQVVSA